MSYQRIVVDGPITLSWPLPFTGGEVAATFNDLVPTAVGPNIGVALPPGNNVDKGTSLVFNNVSLLVCPILDWTGNPIVTLASGGVITVYLTDNSTTAGVWRVIASGDELSAIVSLQAQNTDGSIIVTDEIGTPNPTIEPSGGQLNFNCAPSISNLLSLNVNNQPGILVATTTNPLTYKTISLANGNNIVIDNPDGVLNPPRISLATSLTNLNQIQIGQSILTDGNIVSGANSSMTINTVAINPTGSITTPTSITAATANIGTLTVNTTLNIPNSTINNPQVASAWGTFSDAGSSCGHVEITPSASYGVRIITSDQPGLYFIGLPLSSVITSNYTVLTTLMADGSVLTPFYSFVKQMNSVGFKIVCTDTLGNLVAPAAGVSFVVFGFTIPS